jgi:hypothetical protein
MVRVALSGAGLMSLTLKLSVCTRPLLLVPGPFFLLLVTQPRRSGVLGSSPIVGVPDNLPTALGVAVFQGHTSGRSPQAFPRPARPQRCPSYARRRADTDEKAVPARDLRDPDRGYRGKPFGVR